MDGIRKRRVENIDSSDLGAYLLVLTGARIKLTRLMILDTSGKGFKSD